MILSGGDKTLTNAVGLKSYRTYFRNQAHTAICSSGYDACRLHCAFHNDLLFFILSSGLERRKLILLLTLLLYKRENIKVIHISYYV